jgi:hypothetical protein
MSEAARHLNVALSLLQTQGRTISYGKSVAETIEMWAHEIGVKLLEETRKVNGE